MSQPIDHLSLPLSYRSHLLRRLLPALQDGACCLLLGAGGVGKTHLAHFLLRRDVQAQYLHTDRTWLLLLDLHGLPLGEHSADDLLAERMIRLLLHEAAQRHGADELVLEATRLLDRLQAQPAPGLARRSLHQLCERLGQAHGLKLIFVVDHCDDLWQHMDGRLLLQLHQLREQRQQLGYLLLARHHPRHHRHGRQAVPDFDALLPVQVYGLGMHQSNDARLLLEQRAARLGLVLDDRLTRTALDASGGHAGLLHAVAGALHHSGMQTLTAAELLRVPAVLEECARLWHSLSETEQHLVGLVATGTPLHDADEHALAELRRKELLASEPPALCSPLFAAYVRTRVAAGPPRITLDLRRRDVLLDGQPLARRLAPLEFDLLAYLARHTGQVCARADIIHALHNHEALALTDERLDALVGRLRTTLHEDDRDPRYLITHRDIGVQLLHASVQS